jgi:RNA-directed DNA polymerase
VSLAPPETVRKLQETLHAKAKGSPGYRFYLLYDKVYRRDVLGFAFDHCRSNGGASGIDGQAKRSRTLRRTAWTRGWTNWRTT